MFTNYYGIDWLIFALITIHIIQLGHKKSAAFLTAMLATLCGAIFGLMIQSLATVLMNMTFLFLHFRAYCLWNIKDHKK